MLRLAQEAPESPLYVSPRHVSNLDLPHLQPHYATHILILEAAQIRCCQDVNGDQSQSLCLQRTGAHKGRRSQGWHIRLMQFLIT